MTIKYEDASRGIWRGVEIDDKRNNDSRNNSNIFRLSPCQTIVTTCVSLDSSKQTMHHGKSVLHSRVLETKDRLLRMTVPHPCTFSQYTCRRCIHIPFFRPGRVNHVWIWRTFWKVPHWYMRSSKIPTDSQPYSPPIVSKYQSPGIDILRQFLQKSCSAWWTGLLSVVSGRPGPSGPSPGSKTAWSR